MQQIGSIYNYTRIAKLWYDTVCFEGFTQQGGSIELKAKLEVTS